ncbi:MAG: single-stranded-DNA-specific exonuclease RecJ [Deltaproteobacteria bacterium]|jgi:single-stranded-DNA-specific exonuclease|nr:single-stranded-DNA-specific exonuclease RecJ [Deltaproteobacteria bacterium]
MQPGQPGSPAQPDLTRALDAADLEDLARRLEISPFLAGLLWRRGLRGFEEMNRFLDPGLRYLPSLDDWPGLKDLAARIGAGVLAGKKLLVWGDYDVDGITATALVVDFFRQHGIEVSGHIPDRMGEGYGLNVPDLELLAGQGCKMLLTVDCGICDLAEVGRAKELGLEVFVSDHHLPGEELPEADGICAPTVGDCPSPHLAGVGVAFMLMAAVNLYLEQQGRERVDIRNLLDLVALGTLADVANLSGDNRILVKNGLLVLAEARRPGLAALKASSNYAPNAALGAGQVVFTLAPRINAAGRMGRSDVALRMLLTENRDEAASCAAALESMNAQRRSEEDLIIREAREQAARFVKSGSLGLVLYQPDWHMGVIGIVASRVVEEFHRPTIILCNNHERIKGSGRSVEDFDLHAALGECADLFLSFGGHKMAAGLTIAYENLAPFRERFDAEVRKSFGDRPPPTKIKTDGELSMTQIMDFTLLKELEMLQPFGLGNAEPVFVSPPLLLREVRNRPGLSILDVLDEESGISAKAKIWRPREDLPQSSKGRRLRLAFSPRIDRYNGAANVEIRVRDWHFG